MQYYDIQRGEKYGPYFGNCDFMFKGNMKNCKSYKFGEYYFLDEQVLDKNVNESFKVLEVKIYKIIEAQI